jgi:hypothetical protein
MKVRARMTEPVAELLEVGVTAVSWPNFRL